jgi:hypothetical protein
MASSIAELRYWEKYYIEDQSWWEERGREREGRGLANPMRRFPVETSYIRHALRTQV